MSDRLTDEAILLSLRNMADEIPIPERLSEQNVEKMLRQAPKRKAPLYALPRRKLLSMAASFLLLLLSIALIAVYTNRFPLFGAGSAAPASMSMEDAPEAGFGAEKDASLQEGAYDRADEEAFAAFADKNYTLRDHILVVQDAAGNELFSVSYADPGAVPMEAYPFRGGVAVAYRLEENEESRFSVAVFSDGEALLLMRTVFVEGALRSASSDGDGLLLAYRTDDDREKSVYFYFQNKALAVEWRAE